jgi:sugar lactone lactonase YvrE
VGVQIADGLHPVANPAVDSHGNIYATFSGSRGQKTPVSIFQLEATTGQSVPFVGDLMNASGLAVDQDDVLYASSRHEGNIYRVSSAGNSSIYVEGMGVATGIVFDPDGNLYVSSQQRSSVTPAPDLRSPPSNRRFLHTICPSDRTTIYT